MIEAGMLINIVLGVCIFLIMMMRGIADDVWRLLSIMEKQTRSMEMLVKRTDRQEKVLTFVIESVSIAIEFVWNNGSDDDRKKITETIDKYEEKG